MIWDGDTPAASLACIVDPEKKIYNAYITSYNPDYSKIAPGIVLFSESIKQAIEQNYKFYDFTLGLDPYKLSFGPEQYEIKDLMIKKKRFKTAMTERILKLTKKIIR
jgi:CelD/BcsL family acetyltransferase involved in cellulose biosynthesis